MKIINPDPIIILSEEEKKSLEQAADILEKIFDTAYDIADELLKDQGEDGNSVYHACNTIRGLLAVVTIPNSAQAKDIISSMTADLTID